MSILRPTVNTNSIQFKSVAMYTFSLLIHGDRSVRSCGLRYADIKVQYAVLLDYYSKDMKKRPCEVTNVRENQSIASHIHYSSNI